MDKMLYVAASGASQDLLASAVRANNLANAQTTGFKSMMQQARAMPAFGDGLPTRVFAMTESPANRYDPGALVQTNRELDVAVEGNGWLSVLDKDGNEAYTRNGSLQLGTNGELLDKQTKVTLKGRCRIAIKRRANLGGNLCNSHIFGHQNTVAIKKMIHGSTPPEVKPCPS